MEIRIREARGNERKRWHGTVGKDFVINESVFIVDDVLVCLCEFCFSV